MTSFCDALDVYPYALKFGPLLRDGSIGCHSALDDATAQRLVRHLRNSLLVDNVDDVALIFDDKVRSVSLTSSLTQPNVISLLL